MRRFLLVLCILSLSSLSFLIFKQTPSPSHSSIPTSPVIKQNIKVDVHLIGELEAATSITISSPIKGDAGKIIDLIADGVYVRPGQVLVKLDPSPFEEKIEKIRIQIREEEAHLATLKGAVLWEKLQAKHKNQTAAFEVESAELELEKIMQGDGPQEIARFQAIMNQAKTKYEECKGYATDLSELETLGFLHPVEIKQAEKKLHEELGAYEIAKQQYDNYKERIFPLLVRKAETHLKRMRASQQEANKSGRYQIIKAKTLVEQAKQALADSLLQMREAEYELKQTEIIAPAPGMVVLREEYRSSQRRKARVGDILVKNQPLIDLPNLQSMVVKTSVREIDLFKIAPGKKATITIDAYPELILQGTVSSIGVLALADGRKGGEEKFFAIQITLDASDPTLRPGMTARASIHAQEAIDILTIPVHGVFTEDKQAVCYCPSSSNGYEKREVLLGISSEQFVEVKEGLSSGDLIYLLEPKMVAER